MKRLVPVVAALTLIAVACGGDDSTSETPPADTVEPTDEATSTEENVADTPNESGTSDDADESTTDAATTDDTGDDDTGDTGDREVSIQTIDDIPQECQDEMAEFLRALEPIVSPIDWQTATMADFEQIANDFEAEAEDFERATGDAGCNELAFVDESEGEILLDFARSEAPGAVGFLEFLEQLRTGSTPAEDVTAAPEGIETCDDAIDFLQGLMDDYEAMSAVPASELVKIPSIAPLYAQCTPEQLEFFDNPDLQEFMGG